MSDNKTLPSVTFIIPHRGRTDLLHSTLSSIQLQKYDFAKIRVLILTQNNTDDIKKNLSDINFNFEVIGIDSSITISAIRNRGAAITDSEFIAFIDADIYLSPDWTISMVEALTNYPDRILVSAYQRSGDNPTIVENIRISMGNPIGGKYVDSLPGHNLFLSHKSFDLINGFPEYLKTCEDYYFTSSLAKHGKIYISENAWYIHSGEDKSFSQVFKKEIWRASYNLLSLKGRKVAIKEFPSILLPFWFFLIVLSIIPCYFLFPKYVFIPIGLYFLPITAYSFRLKLSNKDISFFRFFIFYTLFHTARSFGTISGLSLLFKRTNFS